ncbi:ATP-binding protein [Streptomyces sp. W16]|uniref:sensor histidine kinase n=1 Tax=Streptomyces sp. W16 TaxID=3076631 RepID=UPI00295BA979|nr:ATP-binding protein [Streptomyces sp. W16]MDV9168618.1 ATP-binding protein [Streptomyces sp. W16]
MLGGVVIAWRTIQVPTGPLLAVVACGVVVASGVGAVRARTAATAVERMQDAQVQRVTEAATAVEKAVVWAAEELCRGGRPMVPESLPPYEAAGSADEAVALLGEVQVQAVSALIRVHDDSQAMLLLSTLHQFSRREHALVDRALEKLDRLQALTEDPDQLDGIFALDHLVTRLRRWIESKAILAGESLRSARQPVSVTEVLRGAVQEVLHFARVSVAAGTVGAELGLPRHVGPDLTHLLAELVENATQFSDPASKVQMRAHRVARGLAVEVEDRVAIPMRPGDRERWNRLLADPGRVDMSDVVRAGQLGLRTAALIARRHGISVTLSENPTGGTTALVVVPAQLLVSVAVPPRAAVHAPAPATGSSSPPGPQAGGAPARPTLASRRTAPAAPGAGEGAAAPRLPRRVVAEQPSSPEPSRPQPAVVAPRYGLAGDFRSSFDAGRTQDGTTGAVPPASHP